MQNRKEIKSELDMLNVFKIITESYEEISVSRMRQIKDSVLNTRDFLYGLSEVFSDIRIAELSVDEKELRHSKKNKCVAVLITPNSKLYGSIVQKVYKLFLKELANSTCDIVIIGRVGKEYYEDEKKKRPFRFFEVKDANLTASDIKPIVYYLLNYERVNVYHGKFEGIILQNAIETNITGNLNVEDYVKSGAKNEYLFEPSLSTITGFFETQIFASFMKQTVTESQLAGYASRIQAMESALETVDVRSKVLRLSERKVRRELENKKQLGIVSAALFLNL
ncbi:MAG: F0F1 ATP synthase subunit gamma [Patescibacteria group bacterium]